VDGSLVGAATFGLPADLPLGWHTLEVTTDVGTAEGVLVVTPAYVGVPESLERDPAWGFMAQLYSVRSSRSWGLGDLGDLRELTSWSGGELGAGFLLVNPLHAAEPVAPMEPSPYLPVTRRFVNPVYVRVEDVPEYAALSSADATAVAALAEPLRKRNTTDDQLDRDLVWAAKREALGLVAAVPRSAERQEAYAAFQAREGEGLVDFATWCALAETRGLPWGDWPAELHDPRSAAVQQAREELADLVDFYAWLQWVLDEQLAAAQDAGVSAGMRLGIMHDLAVGVHPGGADSWSLQGVLAAGVNVGAPPDAFNQQGRTGRSPRGARTRSPSSATRRSAT
jgi:4-alpha-glucanotransferase